MNILKTFEKTSPNRIENSNNGMVGAHNSAHIVGDIGSHGDPLGPPTHLVQQQQQQQGSPHGGQSPSQQQHAQNQQQSQHQQSQQHHNQHPSSHLHVDKSDDLQSQHRLGGPLRGIPNLSSLPLGVGSPVDIAEALAHHSQHNINPPPPSLSPPHPSHHNHLAEVAALTAVGLAASSNHHMNQTGMRSPGIPLNLPTVNLQHNMSQGGMAPPHDLTDVQLGGMTTHVPTPMQSTMPATIPPPVNLPREQLTRAVIGNNLHDDDGSQQQRHGGHVGNDILDGVNSPFFRTSTNEKPTEAAVAAILKLPNLPPLKMLQKGIMFGGAGPMKDEDKINMNAATSALMVDTFKTNHDINQLSYFGKNAKMVNPRDPKEIARARERARRNALPEDRKAQIREENRIRQKQYRENMSPDERNALREKQKLAERRRRANMTEEQRAAAREKNRIRQQQRREKERQAAGGPSRQDELMGGVAPNAFAHVVGNATEHR